MLPGSHYTKYTTVLIINRIKPDNVKGSKRLGGEKDKIHRDIKKKSFLTLVWYSVVGEGWRCRFIK